MYLMATIQKRSKNDLEFNVHVGGLVIKEVAEGAILSLLRCGMEIVFVGTDSDKTIRVYAVQGCQILP